jgi:hypothetical protein
MHVTKNQIELRKLEEHEVDLVSGGINLLGPGGLFSLRNLTRASRFAGGVGLLYHSAKLGYDIGSWGYANYTHYKYSSR